MKIGRPYIPTTESVVALSTLVAVMTTEAGVLGMIVSQVIGAVLLDINFLEPFLGAKPQRVVALP